MYPLHRSILPIWNINFQSQLHRIFLALDKLIKNHEVLDSAMCNILINGLWKEGYRSEACRMLDMMLEKGWVPDASTHGLLMGSVVREEAKGKLDIDTQDKISNILEEGLGNP